MTDTELLQALSDMIDSKLDSKLKPIADNMVTKDDLKDAKNELYKEIVRAESYSEKIEKRVDTLTDKVDTLLLKADNTALLLKLINQQADEMTALKARLELVEKKLA